MKGDRITVRRQRDSRTNLVAAFAEPTQLLFDAADRDRMVEAVQRAADDLHEPGLFRWEEIRQLAKLRRLARRCALL